jgi:ORF6N domain
MPKSPETTEPIAGIEPLILLLRGQRVIMDSELAGIYGTTTKKMNQQVTRNRDRFPPDFMLRLHEDEKAELVTSCDRFNKLKHSTVLPHAFTEHGAIMVASMLNSPRAVEMSVFVVRAFVRSRVGIKNRQPRRVHPEHRDFAAVAAHQRPPNAHSVHWIPNA